MLNLNDLRMFVKAVESGGFAAAARLLGSPKSTVSKRVAQLETSLGARLIHRTARSFTLSDVGREFYEHARAAVNEAAAAEEVVRRRIVEPSGHVKITASVPIAQFYLSPRLPALLAALPKVEVQIHVSDRFVDLVHEGFDIAVRSHSAPLPDSGLVQRRLSVEQTTLVASPAYIDEHGMPRTPQDLAAHRGIHGSLTAREWNLRNKHTGESAVAIPHASLRVDEAGMLLRAARSGLGVAPLPQSFVREDLETGALLPILPDWFESTITTTILVPHRRGQLPAVRAVIEYLADASG